MLGSCFNSWLSSVVFMNGVLDLPAVLFCVPLRKFWFCFLYGLQLPKSYLYLVALNFQYCAIQLFWIERPFSIISKQKIIIQNKVFFPAARLLNKRYSSPIERRTFPSKDSTKHSFCWMVCVIWVALERNFLHINFRRK